MSKPSTRTILALAIAAVLVVVAAVAGIVAVAVHNAPDDERPTVTAYAHGKAVTVEPFRWCTLGAPDAQGEMAAQCDPEGTSAELNPPLGYPVQLSLPRHIADAPWVMTLEYQHIDNPREVEVHRGTYRDYPDGTLALTVDTHPEPNLRLVGIEMQLLGPTLTEQGDIELTPYQAWSIKTV